MSNRMLHILFLILFLVFSELWRGHPDSKCHLQEDAENGRFCHHQFLNVPTFASLFFSQVLCTNCLHKWVHKKLWRVCRERAGAPPLSIWYYRLLSAPQGAGSLLLSTTSLRVKGAQHLEWWLGPVFSYLGLSPMVYKESWAADALPVLAVNLATRQSREREL